MVHRGKDKVKGLDFCFSQGEVTQAKCTLRPEARALRTPDTGQ